MYDGDHSWKSTYQALTQYYERLEDLAVIIVDDWNWEEVQYGTKKAIQDLHLPIIFEKEIILKDEDVAGMPRHAGKETWWNGIYVAIIHKGLRAQENLSSDSTHTVALEKPVAAQNHQNHVDLAVTTSPINIIIFSKDRACQLEALLRSMQEYFHYPYIAYILYDASSAEYERGYERLIPSYPEIIWIRQSNFKADFLSLLHDTVNKAYPYLMFLVDDILFVREFTGTDLLDRFAADQDILAVSLRMGEILPIAIHGISQPLPRIFCQAIGGNGGRRAADTGTTPCLRMVTSFGHRKLSQPCLIFPFIRQIR